jgi:hypothetical protein
MSLIDSVFDLCKNKLVGNGCDRLLKEGHGLDINQKSRNLWELAPPQSGKHRF